jgi:8-oxo-dGTP diphosphatase
MHRHQHEILCRLADMGASRYAQLKPATLEGNVFVYHVKALVKQRLVKKDGLTYVLTPQGYDYVDRLSTAMRQPRIQPKIVTLAACQNEAGEWLLYRRAREPFRGKVGFPYGKIHLGEAVQQAAERELFDKTGLRASLKHLGEAYIAAYHKRELISHMLCHVFVAEELAGTPYTESSIGECFWARLEDIPVSEQFPGLAHLVGLVERGLPFELQELNHQI